jgi:hypothetical protein
MVDYFNKFLAEVGLSIHADIGRSRTSDGDYRTNLHYSEILLSHFNPTTESEILEVIGGLRPNIAVSYDGISAKFLKKYSTTFAPKISLLITDCLERGIRFRFP